jgi:hypothetical protein
MRCYLMKGGHIAGVKLLKPDTSDAEMIEEAKAIFFHGPGAVYDGFEVWDRARFIYRYPEDERPK